MQLAEEDAHDVAVTVGDVLSWPIDVMRAEDDMVEIKHAMRGGLLQ